MIDIYEVRARYTTPDNSCKAGDIERLAPIAIAYDIASLVGEIETLQSENRKLSAEVKHLQARLGPQERAE